MVKITVDIDDEHDKKLRHMVVEKNMSSKAEYIEQIINKYLDDIKSVVYSEIK
jgi:Arc/MetJ-type ribon-helix-helix transcriptional regulator